MLRMSITLIMPQIFTEVSFINKETAIMEDQWPVMNQDNRSGPACSKTNSSVILRGLDNRW